MRAPEVHHEDELTQVLHGDCRGWLERQVENSIDLMATDSPYEDGVLKAKWNNTGISFDVEVWKMCLAALKPGAIYLNFALPRLYHKLATSVEAAGFVVVNMFEWFYGQGQPPHYTHVKPAHEPILVAMKPFSEPTLEANRRRWGVGGLWPEQAPIQGPKGRTRHATNVFFSHLDDCEEGACRPGCRVAELDFQSGVRKSGVMRAGTLRARKAGGTFGPMSGAPMAADTIGDEGGASRFYFCGKIRGQDRLGHESEKPEDLIEQLVRLACPLRPSYVVDPFVGSGPTLAAARRLGHRSTGVELMKEHCRMTEKRLERNAERAARLAVREERQARRTA